MQIFVKDLSGKSQVYTISQQDQVQTLIELINNKEGVSVENSRLTFQGKLLMPENSISELGIQEGSSIDSFIPLVGGAGISNTNMEPAFIALCQKYVYNKKICRECYATNPIKATTCRKRKCGKSGNLRLKKVVKK